jgi:tetratricopeptide (TPR) repeat protein
MTHRGPRAGSSAPAAGAPRSLRAFAVVYASFALLGIGVYRGALSGPLVSDDYFLIAGNPYLALPAPELLRASFAPRGDARHFAGGNYAPVLHLAHALEARLFRADTRPYHLVNVLVHALNAALLSGLLLRSGLSRGASLGASLLFLLHPANVEAVAWISQLRTLLAMACALGALLLLPRLPIFSAGVFAVGLLAKASASFVLPMAALQVWTRRRRGEPIRRSAAGLALWTIAFLAYAPIQFSVFSSIARGFGDPYPDLATHLRSVLAIGARYLAMAAAGYGVSAFHEPSPVHSNLDLWFLTGTAAAACLGARIALTLRDARPEAAWWLSAAAGFAPVSQLFPFFFGMGDRYLYFILPGLLGGAFLAGSDLSDALARRSPGGAAARCAAWLSGAARVGVLGLAVAFAAHASGRARLWQSEDALLSDAASQYPDGSVGHYVRAVIALQQGDRDRALRELEASAARGGSLIRAFRGDPHLVALNGDPRYGALLREADRMEIEALEKRGSDDPRDLYKIASAHRRLGELDRAVAALERGLRIGGGGPMETDLLALLMQVRREREARSQIAPGSANDLHGPARIGTDPVQGPS